MLLFLQVLKKNDGRISSLHPYFTARTLYFLWYSYCSPYIHVLNWKSECFIVKFSLSLILYILFPQYYYEMFTIGATLAHEK